MIYDAIILGSGNATRLQKSNEPIKLKSFQEIDDKSVILHIIDNILNTEVNNIYIVHNVHYSEYHFNLIKNHINNRKKLYFILQEEINGTGYAVKLVHDKFYDILLEKIIVFYGDLPFINCINIKKSLKKLNNLNYCGVINTYDNDCENSQHGKIIFDENNIIKSVIEYKSYKNSKKIAKLKKCGGGLFIIKKKILSILLKKIKINIDSGECSIFSIIEIAYHLKYYFTYHKIHHSEAIGVDDEIKLKRAKEIYKKFLIN